MKTNYVLIDFENVQPQNLEALKSHGFKLLVFVGSNQTKVSFDLASAMQAMGENAEYVKIEGNGPNALDFHIAFYIGNIAAKDPDSFFYIISNDTGFDPLIKHLKTKKIHAQRELNVTKIPLLKISNSNSKSIHGRIDTIIEFLKARGSAKPRTVNALLNSINSLFQRKLEEKELSKIIDELVSKKIVIKNESKVTYLLP